MCVCLWCGRRTHPTLENPSAQNVAAYENQGKEHDCSDQWKSIKTLWKKTGHGSKKKKRLPEMQVLTKDFTSYKIKYKFLRKRK